MMETSENSPEEGAKKSTIPPWQRNRPLKTVALYMAFVVFGMAYSMLGPSLVSMEILLGSTLDRISAGFTGESIGYLVGAIACGFLYDRINKELLFTISLLITGVATVMIPYSRNVGMFFGAMAVQGLSMAFVDTGSQSYILKLWEGHYYMPAVMQALHSMWSVGSTIGPFILQPFLADIGDYDSDTAITSINQSYSTNSTEYYVSQTTAQDIEDDVALKHEVASVRFGFIIGAVAVFITAIVFLAAFFTGEPSFLEHHRKRLKKSNKSEGTYQPQILRRFHIKLLCIVVLYYFLFSWIENLPAHFVAAFVVKGLGWRNDEGSLITSVYWGSHGAGRILGILIAMCLKPKQMVIGDLVFTLTGFILMTFSSYHFSIIWIATATAGFGIATLFPSALLYVEEYIEVTGSTSAVVMVSTSFGGMTGPPLVGFLMEKFGYMSLAYTCLAAASVELIIFVGIILYTYRYGVLRRKPRTETKSDKSSVDTVEMKPLKK